MKRVGPAPQTVFTLTLTQVDTATVESSQRVERDWLRSRWPLAAGLYSALGSSSPPTRPRPRPGRDHNLMSWPGILSWRLYTSGARDPHYPVHRVHPKSHITIPPRHLSNGKKIVTWHKYSMGAISHFQPPPTQPARTSPWLLHCWKIGTCWRNWLVQECYNCRQCSGSTLRPPSHDISSITSNDWPIIYHIFAWKVGVGTDNRGQLMKIQFSSSSI